MRGINCIDQATGRRRSFDVGDPESTFYANPTGANVEIDGVTWSVTSRRGERSPVPYGFDSELDDGDAT